MDIAVTGDNRREFVDAYVKWILTDSVSSQFDEFLKGFNRVVAADSTSLFMAEELELLVAGVPHLDFNELQKATEYIGWSQSDPSTNPTVQYFWSVVEELTAEQQQKLLMFATGSTRAPIGGLQSLDFKLQRMGPNSNSLPTSHTCFNTLLIPEYSSREVLKERLLKAIEECEGFGLK